MREGKKGANAISEAAKRLFRAQFIGTATLGAQLGTVKQDGSLGRLSGFGIPCLPINATTETELSLLEDHTGFDGHRVDRHQEK